MTPHTPLALVLTSLALCFGCAPPPGTTTPSSPTGATQPAFDGSSGAPLVAESAPGDFSVGDRVLCRWQGGGTEYPGRVATVEDGRLFIEYDDGDTELIDPALCRNESSSSGGSNAGLVGPFAGDYEIARGENPNGSSYAGRVRIGHDGQAVRMLWQLADGANHGGVGIHHGDTLGVGWGPPDRHGIVAYRVQGGELIGQWASESTGAALGVEHLRGPSGLSGTYQIVRGESPQGSAYSGEVDITPHGPAYHVRWRLPNETYEGVGLTADGVLYVGWGTGEVGIVVYQKNGGMLKGRWAAPITGGGPVELGSEDLAAR